MVVERHVTARANKREPREGQETPATPEGLGTSELRRDIPANPRLVVEEILDFDIYSFANAREENHPCRQVLPSRSR
jgi:hypothetical protein